MPSWIVTIRLFLQIGQDGFMDIARGVRDGRELEEGRQYDDGQESPEGEGNPTVQSSVSFHCQG